MAAGFQNVRRAAADRQSGAANEVAVQNLLNTPGAVAVPGGISIGGAPGSVGETSKNFYDDPVVNALVGLPSEKQAEDYTGAHPSFYGVQRPGDYQRVVQRQMAGDALPGGDRELSAMQEAERQRQIHLSMTRPGYGLT